MPKSKEIIHHSDVGRQVDKKLVQKLVHVNHPNTFHQEIFIAPKRADHQTIAPNNYCQLTQYQQFPFK